jgi:hypothetical protein
MTPVRAPAPTISAVTPSFAATGDDPRGNRWPDARHRAVRRGLRSVAVAAACALGMLAPAGAKTIPAYFGWNYVSDVYPADGVPPPVPAAMDLTSFTYDGGSGAGEVMKVPAFPGYTGLPDGNGLAYIPTYTTVLNGDGETTRNNALPAGRLLPIDWVPANTAAPYLLNPVPYPTIGISSFTTNALGVPFGNYAGFPNVGPGAGVPDYIVGLIQSNAVPLQPNEELYSTLPIYQGDIYGAANITAGNPTLSAINQIGGRDQITVIFAAAAPEPASVAVLALPTLFLFGLRRARRG